jgi:hypothetical protein
MRFKIEKGASKPKVLHCSKCRVRMKKGEVEMQVGEYIYAKLDGFECPKCGKRYLGLHEAKKMDKAMLLAKALSGNFTMERKLSFDGDNFTFRIPKELTKKVSKRKVEITPLGSNEFCAMVE